MADVMPHDALQLLKRRFQRNLTSPARGSLSRTLTGQPRRGLSPSADGSGAAALLSRPTSEFLATAAAPPPPIPPQRGTGGGARLALRRAASHDALGSHAASAGGAAAAGAAAGAASTAQQPVHLGPAWSVSVAGTAASTATSRSMYSSSGYGTSVSGGPSAQLSRVGSVSTAGRTLAGSTTGPSFTSACAPLSPSLPIWQAHDSPGGATGTHTAVPEGRRPTTDNGYVASEGHEAAAPQTQRSLSDRSLKPGGSPQSSTDGQLPGASTGSPRPSLLVRPCHSNVRGPPCSALNRKPLRHAALACPRFACTRRATD